MDMANILLIVINIVYMAGKAAIFSIIAFIVIRCSIISAVKALKKENIL